MQILVTSVTYWPQSTTLTTNFNVLNAFYKFLLYSISSCVNSLSLTLKNPFSQQHTLSFKQLAVHERISLIAKITKKLFKRGFFKSSTHRGVKGEASGASGTSGWSSLPEKATTFLKKKNLVFNQYKTRKTFVLTWNFHEHDKFQRCFNCLAYTRTR